LTAARDIYKKITKAHILFILKGLGSPYIRFLNPHTRNYEPAGPPAGFFFALKDLGIYTVWMPELPEVEIVRRGLEPVLAGAVLTRVDVKRRDLRRPIPEGFEASMRGQRMARLERRGKYIIGFTNNGRGFVLHLGMSGRMRIYNPGQVYAPEKHDHVSFEVSTGARIVFNDPRRFGMLYGIQEHNWADEPPFAAMGPEPLGNAFSGPVLAGRLGGRTSPIKIALLDQNVIAGVGNIYACEALYAARIDPFAPAAGLDLAACNDLAQAIRDVLLRAIAAGGSSLKDYRHPDDGLGYFQHDFAVYDRAGQACGSCVCDPLKSGGVHRIVQSGRSTFYCPQLQSGQNGAKT
jgi:formamidopyrimidine-DNA glycosylase